MEDIPNKIQNYLKDKMAQQELTVEELSEKSGVPVNSISNILRGTTQNPGILNLVSIVRALGGSFDDMLGIKEDRLPDSEIVKGYKIALEGYRHTEEVLTRHNKRLFIILMVVLAMLMAWIGYDALSPQTGYIQYGHTIAQETLI